MYIDRTMNDEQERPAANAASEMHVAVREILEAVEVLGADELLVLARISRRLRDGRSCYGALRINDDPRDYLGEGSEEAFDLSVYLACELERRARKGAR